MKDEEKNCINCKFTHYNPFLHPCKSCMGYSKFPEIKIYWKELLKK